MNSTDPSDAMSQVTLDRSAVTSRAMPVGRAQVLSLALIGLFAVLSILPHWLLWGMPAAPTGLSSSAAGILAALLVGGIIVHEALHGIGYRWGGADWADIEFGFNWAGLAPYAHCTAPLRCRSYRRAVALPGLVLGGFPLVVGLGMGRWDATLLAFVMLAAAAGDALLLWMLRGVGGADWVQDHPRKMGALVLGHRSAETPPRLAFDLGEGAGEAEGPEAESPEAEGPEANRGDAIRWGLIILAVSLAAGGIAGFLAATM